MTPSLPGIKRRLLMLISFVLPCLIVAGTLSSSNGSLVRLAGSFGTIAQKPKLVNPVVNRAQDLGNRQATTFEEEKSRIGTIEMKMQNSTRAEKSVDTSKREDPQPLGWNRCRQGPCSKFDNCTVHDPRALDKCCSIVLEQLLHGLQDFLRDKGVSFYIMFGTLLGAHRDGAIIPWTSDLDVVVEADFTHVLERIHEWNETFYFWMENRHIGRMCIVDNDDENAKTWGAWDKIPTYVDVYVPKHVAKNVARSSEAKTVFPVVPRCVFNTVDIYGSEIVQNSTFTQLRIRDFNVYAPARAVAILNHIYTTKWMNPDEAKSPHGSGQCQNDDQLYYNKLVSLAK
tara:strand:+ start:1030 stop:2055 length:1026 start_codon:yes stop_codon:yes gene_type:complete